MKIMRERVCHTPVTRFAEVSVCIQLGFTNGGIRGILIIWYYTTVDIRDCDKGKHRDELKGSYGGSIFMSPKVASSPRAPVQ